ncbi:MAG: carbamoyltransferase HypF [Deltaproteobacteria bacterium]|nr:carbamoyltransferase HypF [Deltaproteobacteria bacterium]
MSGSVRVALHVRGLVQGVGFRPFVLRQARRLGLSGRVWNTSEGVEIEAEGPPKAIAALQDTLRREAPPIARVDGVEVETRSPTGESGFTIVQSERRAGDAALVSPDVATCDACLEELWDPANRRYRYPFVNCTDCGPRFTIVERVPYDRPFTTMRAFDLCPACAREYADPNDRRYHAEPNACPACGPRLSLCLPDGAVLDVPDALEAAQERLRKGEILAIKGLGGYHLACLARAEDAVCRLRARKGRPRRPLAVMCRDLATARDLCRISAIEAEILASLRRPILLLAVREDAPLAPSVAPGLTDVGVMLPYTPLHHLLVAPDDLAVLVMTSGNRSGGPMVAEDAEAIARLGGIADAFLVHDRRIANRCDDSVGFVLAGAPGGDRLVLVRRSRGFVPLPVDLPVHTPPGLAVGAMLAETFALAAGRRAFLSQHVGDTDDVDTLAFLAEAVEGLRRWLGIDPEHVACDLHPDLPTTRYAEGLGLPVVRVQHHHAHMASAMAAAGITEPVQAWTCDGTGYGPDRTTWGCELLVGTSGSAQRVAHLKPMPLPGSEAAVRRPLRTAVGWLHAVAPATADLPIGLWTRARLGELIWIRQMVDRQVRVPLASSAGRLFDAVAAILDVCDDATYEGQAAMELEHLARPAEYADGPRLTLDLASQAGPIVLDPSSLLEGLATAHAAGQSRVVLAARFHAAFAAALVETSRRVAAGGGPRRVLLCGGTFQNQILLRACALGLAAAGLEPELPGPVPTGDGGVSLGQVLVAAAVAAGQPGRVEI